MVRWCAASRSQRNATQSNRSPGKATGITAAVARFGHGISPERAHNDVPRKGHVRARARFLFVGVQPPSRAACQDARTDRLILVRLRLDTTAALVDCLPALSLDEIRQRGGRKGMYAEQRQRALAKMLSCSYEHCHPHKTEIGASYFSRDSFLAEFHVDKNGDAYKRLIEPFYDFPHGDNNYDKDRRLTKPYYLNGFVLEALQSVYEGQTPLPVIDENNSIVTRRDLPCNGIPAPLDADFFVPSVIEVPIDRIDRAISHVDDLIRRDGEHQLCNPQKGRGLPLGECRRSLFACRQWAMSIGGLPNFYSQKSDDDRETANGRLYPTTYTHAITLPRPLRELVLSEPGRWDYDFKSCYWSIFRSVCRAIGFQTPRADEYVLHRGDTHAHWIDITHTGTKDDYKAIALSWLSGARLSSWHETEGVQLLGLDGHDAMKILVKDSIAKSLYKEVRDGMTRIVEHTREIGNVRDLPNGKRVYVNAVGAELKTEPAPSRGRIRKRGRIWSHLLTGYEQFAMRAICPHVPGLVAIIYDGFLAPWIAVEPLEQHVRESSRNALGIELDMELKAEPFGARQSEMVA
jgi:hypothetical protein